MEQEVVKLRSDLLAANQKISEQEVIISDAKTKETENLK
jgi:hypothetical protein